jgi:spermidine synthase
VPRPFTLVDSVDTPEGKLELRRRGDDFLVSIAGRVLMTSHLHRTEDAVATVALEKLGARPAPRVVLGGLGLGFTLRAALDALPKNADVLVAELNAVVVSWCKDVVAERIGHALADPRVRVEIADLMKVVRSAKDLDAIIIDLYEGPKAVPRGKPDPLYGDAAVDAIWQALAPGGVYAVWSEDPYAPFEQRLRARGFEAEHVRVGGGGPRHALYIARRPKTQRERVLR